MAFDLFTLSKERRDMLKEVYFDRYVDKKGPDDCWEWKSTRLPAGYGTFDKRLGKKVYKWYAHRVAWMLHYNSPIPPKLVCCHSCDNPPCVNPLHIMLATQKYNLEHARLKRRRRDAIAALNK